MEPTYQFSEKLQIWSPKDASSWHFLVINKTLAKKIKAMNEEPRRGFGALKVSVTVGETNWKTSIFPTKDGTYFLPIKAQVRKTEDLKVGKIVQTIITLI